MDEQDEVKIEAENLEPRDTESDECRGNGGFRGKITKNARGECLRKKRNTWMVGEARLTT